MRQPQAVLPCSKTSETRFCRDKHQRPVRRGNIAICRSGRTAVMGRSCWVWRDRRKGRQAAFLRVRTRPRRDMEADIAPGSRRRMELHDDEGGQLPDAVAALHMPDLAAAAVGALCIVHRASCSSKATRLVTKQIAVANIVPTIVEGPGPRPDNCVQGTSQGPLHTASAPERELARLCNPILTQSGLVRRYSVSPRLRLR